MKQEWINALRSGKYKQGRRKLRDGDYFCCLGVLCDLVNKDNWIYSPEYGLPLSWIDETKTYESEELPIALGERLFTAKRGSVNAVFFILAERNDFGCSFEEIADLIEAKLEDK